MGIYKKLHDIQKHINGLGKDKKSYGFDYVTGNKILSYIRPKMNELGLLLKQEVISIDNQRIDYKVKSGDKSEILSKVMMRFTWVDIDTSETDINLFGANGQNDWEKGLGSALTYGERYFLLKYFHIPTDEDDIDNPERKPLTESFVIKEKDDKSKIEKWTDKMKAYYDKEGYDKMMKYAKDGGWSEAQIKLVNDYKDSKS